MENKSNPSNIRREIRQAAARLKREEFKDFKSFRKCYFRDYEKRSPAFHDELASILEDLDSKCGQKFALAAPRGHGKSTIVTVQYALYKICRSQGGYIIIISHTAAQARDALANIKIELETNLKLRADFPDICMVDEFPGVGRWRADDIVMPNNIRVTALGSGQQIRGKRHGRKRPELIVIDDVEGDARAGSYAETENLDAWLSAAVSKAGDPSTNILMLGTMHHYHSLLARYTDGRSKPGWRSKIYKAIITPAKAIELWAQWEKIFKCQGEYAMSGGFGAAEVYFQEHKTEMLEGSSVLWEDQYDYYSLMVRKTEDEPSFLGEMQNEPINPADCVFQEEKLHFWDKDGKSVAELLVELGSDQVEYYGACDPSTGKYADHGDFSGIVTLARHKGTGWCYVIDADIVRCDTTALVDLLVNRFRDRNYVNFIFEDNGFQDVILKNLREKANKELGYCPATGVTSKGDKKQRIELLKTPLNDGSILLSQVHPMLLSQVRFFPKGKMDGLDALVMAYEEVKRRVKSKASAEAVNAVMKRCRQSGNRQDIYYGGRQLDPTTADLMRGGIRW